MKVLIIGSGGREHALAWVCSRSRLAPEITCVPGNGGTAGFARNIGFDPGDIDRVVAFAIEKQFDLVIVGPEAPLVDGITDRLSKYGIRVFGPSAAAARIEGSKVFARQLMANVGVPSVNFAAFTDFAAAESYIYNRGAPVVVKASGLAAGKGVIICQTVQEAVSAAREMLMEGVFGTSGREIVVEEFLTGREASLLCLADGEDFLLLPPSRDHKRAFDGDKGTNTGGMGAYSPLEDLDDSDTASIAEMVFTPVLKKLVEMGTPYRGCLYAGLIMTSDGVRVLEFNCRFGDPEVQAVLPLLTVDLLELMAEVAEGGLADRIAYRGMSRTGWRQLSSDMHAVTVVTAAEGYPGSYQKGMKVTSLPEETDRVIPFHAGTKLDNGELVTSGGRVLAVTGLGNSHSEAVETAYKAVELIQFEGMRYRSDIGRQVPA